jgi:hypothetical protein
LRRFKEVLQVSWHFVVYCIVFVVWICSCLLDLSIWFAKNATP